MMNLVDWSIFAIILVSGLIGLFNSFVKEMLSLLAWLISLAVAIIFIDDLANVLTILIPFADLRVGVALTTLFSTTFLVTLWINYLILNSLGYTQIAGFDRVLGIFFGSLRGGVIVTFFIMLAGLTHLPTTTWWENSLVIQYFKPIVQVLRSQLPTEVAKQFQFDSASKH
jgi:membrane protein required for colicin V production